MYQEWGAEGGAKEGGLYVPQAERGHGEVTPSESLAFPKPKHPLDLRNQPWSGTQSPRSQAWEHESPSPGGPHSPSCLGIAGGRSPRAPEVDADFACLTPQTLLGISGKNKRGGQ